MGMRLRKDDEVVVIAGSDKGKRGRILQLFPKMNRVVVAGINVRTIHKKGQNQPQRQEAGIDVSNVALLDKATGKPTRIGSRVLENGSKVRIARATGQVIEG